jgi:hypothetical protein
MGIVLVVDLIFIEMGRDFGLTDLSENEMMKLDGGWPLLIIMVLVPRDPLGFFQGLADGYARSTQS